MAAVNLQHVNAMRPTWADKPFMDWLWEILRTEGSGSSAGVLMPKHAMDCGAVQIEAMAKDEFGIVIPHETACEMFSLCATLLVVDHIECERTIPKAIESYIRTHATGKA
jgi:hypothetical protein